MISLEKEEVDKVFSIHLKVLSYLLNGKSFDWINNKHQDSFDQTNYLENVIRSRLLSFDKNDVLIGAYPISPFKTNYKITVDGVGSGYSMCAVDALGVAYVFKAKTIIDTIDAATKVPLRITIDPNLEKQEPQNVIVSYDAVSCADENRDDNVSAISVCPSIDFYQSFKSIPADKSLSYLSFEEALASAKFQFTQTALKTCIEKKAPKHEVLKDEDRFLL